MKRTTSKMYGFDGSDEEGEVLASKIVVIKKKSPTRQSAADERSL